MASPSLLKQQARRDAAIARPELRTPKPYISVVEGLPDIGRPITAFAMDGPGSPYKLPFPVVYRGKGVWYNAKHERPLDVTIVGWWNCAP